jgi:tetratricopeptide (TPR) repeat protein
MPQLLTDALTAFRSGDLDRARELALSQLEREPTSAQVHHLIGLIDCRCGRFDAGVEWLRRASDADPANIGFRVMLVRALVDSGRPGEALACADRPARTGSADLPLWHARAEAGDAAGRPDIAAEAWQCLCAADPNDWRAWANLGRSLLALDRLDDASDAYRRALSINWHIETVHQLGLVYERANRNDLLSQLLGDALDRRIPKNRLADLWAVLELRRGDPKEALECLQCGTPGGDPARWWRLNAKIADALQDPESAFDAATRMNRLTPDYDMWRERGSAYRQELHGTARTITSRWAKRLPVISAPERIPAFLVGFPRSGTTLLDTFLMGHSEVAVIEERGLLARIAEAAGPIESLPAVAASKLEHLRKSYLAAINDELGGRDAGVVVDKAPLNMLRIPLMQIFFPNAPILFVQRHPCDAVLSGFMQSFAPNLGMASFLDLADAADFYDRVMGVWMACRTSMPLRIHTVIYEDLVRDPEPTLREALAFLDLGWDERVLDHRATAARRGALANTSYDQVTQPLTTAAVGRWKQYERQLAPVLPVLLPWAERLGHAA